MTAAPTSEILNAAADLIEKRGWVHGSVGWDRTPNGPLCIEGAIMAALGIKDEDRTDMWVCPAYIAVADYLSMPAVDAEWANRLVWRWNDKAAESATEVIEVLRATAVIEAARESATAAESVLA